MPITFTLDHHCQEISAIAVGPVSYSDLESHLRETRQWQSYAEFVDGRNAVAAFTPADARRIVELMRELNQETPIAPKAILALPGHAFGLTRMIELLTDDFCEVRAFLDETEARTWLGWK